MSILEIVLYVLMGGATLIYVINRIYRIKHPKIKKPKDESLDDVLPMLEEEKKDQKNEQK